MNQLYVAVDPGPHTGFAWAETSNGVVHRVNADQAKSESFEDWLNNTLEAWGPLTILIVERFTISMRTIKSSTAGSLEALGVIGVCRYLARIHGVEPMSLQAPSDVMNLFTDSRLKTLGYHTKGKGHANDAMRHLCYRLAKDKLIRLGDHGCSE